MTKKQIAIIEQFRALVAAAHKAGLAVCVDADAMAIRLIPKRQEAKAIDLSRLGETVSVDNACGGGSAKVSGSACNYGVS